MDPIERIRRILRGDVDDPVEFDRLMAESMTDPVDQMLWKVLDDDSLDDTVDPTDTPWIAGLMERQRESRLLPLLLQHGMPAPGEQAVGKLPVDRNK